MINANLLKNICISFMCIYGLLINPLFAQTENQELNKKQLLESLNNIEGYSISKIKKFLENTPPSVTDKSIMASGDQKNDYYSFAPYYWPNPKNSYSSGLPYVRIDGVRNRDLVNQGDSPRFKKMAISVILLSRLYQATDEEKYAKKAVGFLQTWFINPKTMMKPNVEHGQMIIGKNSGSPKGILELRYNISIIEVIPILLKSNQLSDNDLTKIKSWYSDYFDWLTNSELGKKASEHNNNHGTWYDAQLLSVAIFLDKKDDALKILNKIKSMRLDKQINTDGQQPMELKRTRSLFYSLFNLEALFAIAELAKKLDVDLWSYQTENGRSINKAYDYVSKYKGTESSWPNEQIYKVKPWVWTKLDKKDEILLNIFR